MPPKHRTNPFLCAFLALLWLGATFAFFGSTGKHSDDYWATLWSIDGSHLDWSHTPWQARHYFWRPLHLIHIWFNNSLFWSHNWVPHLELALVHGLVCILLYRLLVRLNSARGPAFCAAVLFGTFPLLGEAANWSSASCNAIGAALMLWTLLLVHRLASRPVPQSDQIVEPLPLGLIAAIMALAFATACFYEPAAAGLAVAPLLAWAAAKDAPKPARIQRIAWATFAAGAPCILYIVLLVWTAPKGTRGAAENLVHLSDLPAVAAHYLHKLRVILLGDRGRELLLGSIEQGWGVVRHRTTVTAIVLATVVAGALALFAFARTPRDADEPPRGRTPRGLLPILGVLLFFIPLAPFIVSGAKGVEARSLYIPLLGAAILIAGAGNTLRRISLTLEPAVRRPLAISTFLLVGLAAIAGQIGLIGFQAQFRNNARLDARVADQLARLAASVEPKTVFLILQCDHRGAATSHRTYNGAIHTALEAPWSATIFLRRAMKRTDVHLISGSYWHGSTLPIGDLARTNIHVARDGGGYALDWNVIAPIWIDANADVHIADTLTVQPSEGEAFDVSPERARRLRAAQGGPAVRPNSRHFKLISLGRDQSRIVQETLPHEQTPLPNVPIIPGGEPATQQGR